MALDPNKTPELVTIAKISGVHGVKGQVKIQSFTEPMHGFLKYKNYYWFYNGSWQPMPVVNKTAKKLGNNIVLSISGCTDRDEAKKYQFIDIAVPKTDLPILKPGEYYWVELTGLEVFTVHDKTIENQYLGVVDHLFETGSNDVLVVKNGENEYLIPYILEQFVLSIDLDKNQMIVDWDPNF